MLIVPTILFLFLNSIIDKNSGTNNNAIKPIDEPIIWIKEEVVTTSKFSFKLNNPARIPAPIPKTIINVPIVMDSGFDLDFKRLINTNPVKQRKIPSHINQPL